jgi:hypothetical protein
VNITVPIENLAHYNQRFRDTDSKMMIHNHMASLERQITERAKKDITSWIEFKFKEFEEAVSGQTPEVEQSDAIIWEESWREPYLRESVCIVCMESLPADCFALQELMLSQNDRLQRLLYPVCRTSNCRPAVWANKLSRMSEQVDI